MDRIRFIVHRERRVLLIDFSGCSANEVAEISDQVPETVTQEAPGSVVALADFTDAEFSREAVERIKIATAIDKRYIRRAAWVLASNLPKALYDSVRIFSGREFPVFATREEALDYLVS